MRDDDVPFRFDLRDTLGRLKAMSRVKGVSIRVPGISLNVELDDVERKVAREIVIRLADRRVLNSRECCDSCISNALSSIEKIRILLVDKQVELSDHVDRPLYLLIQFALEGLRQFLTFQEQSLRACSTDRRRRCRRTRTVSRGWICLSASIPQRLGTTAVSHLSHAPANRTDR